LRTRSTSSAQIVVPVVTSERIDALAAANRLAGAVQLRTITDEDGYTGTLAEFVKLHAYLQRQFPSRTRPQARSDGDAACFYTWVGTDPSAPAVMLMAHQDVAPIAPHGRRVDGRSIPRRHSGRVRVGPRAAGRQGQSAAELEAVERLIAEGFQPRRTIYLAFGDDEEVAANAARRIAAVLGARGNRPSMRSTRNACHRRPPFKGIDAPVAIIGTAEKAVPRSRSPLRRPRAIRRCHPRTRLSATSAPGSCGFRRTACRQRSMAPPARC
jgi:carboxypeptidase PM20D1